MMVQTDNRWLARGVRSISVVWRDIGRTARRFRHASIPAVLGSVGRAIRLHFREPPARQASERAERIVISLTTTPARLARILPVLHSLLEQTCPADRIVLALPARSRRTGAAYPAPPPLPAGVDILDCEDEGPATKLLPALRAEPDALIVVVDDDVIYPKDFIANLLAAHRQQPHAALGLRGWRLESGVDPRDYDHVFTTAIREAEPVDVLLGTWGYLIPPHAFDNAIFDFDGYPPEVRWVDDVWVSGHLARRGVPRLVIPGKSFPLETRAAFVFALTDTVNASGRNDAIAVAAFEKWW